MERLCCEVLWLVVSSKISLSTNSVRNREEVWFSAPRRLHSCGPLVLRLQSYIN